MLKLSVYFHWRFKLISFPSQSDNTQYERYYFVLYSWIFISQDHGPFNDLEKLHKRPAHLAVFLNYVISAHAPEALVSLTQFLFVQYIVEHGLSVIVRKTSVDICCWNIPLVIRHFPIKLAQMSDHLCKNCRGGGKRNFTFLNDYRPIPSYYEAIIICPNFFI